ncbi:FAD-dependent oxidoreductase [bacterium]|nr:FAD-dependent oxidoreductase [bacterium]
MKEVYDVIIIGGGPAGITCAIYAQRKKLRTLLLTKDFLGQTVKAREVNNYPGFLNISGLSLMKRLKKHLKSLDVVVKEKEQVVRVGKMGNIFQVSTASQKKFWSKTVVIATGRDPRPLEIPGEKEFIGKGVFYSEVSKGSLFRDKSAVVIGAGNSGLEAALDLAKYAKRVFVLEKTKRIAADEITKEKVAKSKKIRILLEKQIVKIVGPKRVRAILYKDVSNNHLWQLPADGVFVQINSIPATAFVKRLCKLNSRDEIEVDFQTCATSQPGIFAAGDVNNGKWKQIVIAAAEGARAALAAYNYLHKTEKI